MPSLPALPVPPPVHAAPAAVPLVAVAVADAGFALRWDAWVARGTAQDAAFRHRLNLFLQVGFALTACLGAFLLSR